MFYTTMFYLLCFIYCVIMVYLCYCYLLCYYDSMVYLLCFISADIAFLLGYKDPLKLTPVIPDYV